MLSLGATSLNMTRRCLLEQMLLTLMTDVFALPFTTVFLMGHDSGILVLGLGKYICTTITPETGEFMLFVLV